MRALTQIPEFVLSAVDNLIRRGVANVGRSSHEWAHEAEDMYRRSRSVVAREFQSVAENVVFTSGATESSNIIAFSWGLWNLEDGDEVVCSTSDHQSFTLPWFKLAELLRRRGVRIKIVDCPSTAGGHVDLEQLKSIVNRRTRLVNVTHVHNVSGAVNDLAQIREAIGEDCLLSVDCAQSVSHKRPDLLAANVDFAFFSGHKCFALSGIGGLVLSPRAQSEMEPLSTGGGHHSGIERFEPGTPNFVGAHSLAFAFEFINGIGRDQLESQMRRLTEVLYEEFLWRTHLESSFLVKPYEVHKHSSLASFRVPGMDSRDVAEILSEEGIYLRSGSMCTGTRGAPVSPSLRISLQIYNSFVREREHGRMRWMHQLLFSFLRVLSRLSRALLLSVEQLKLLPYSSSRIIE